MHSFPLPQTNWYAKSLASKMTLAPFALAELLLPHVDAAVFFGDASSGKSTAAKRTGTGGRKVYVVQCQPDGSVADWLGQPWIRPEGMVWKHGAMVNAWLEGARVVVEELHKISPEQMALLHKIMDDPDIAEMQLPTLEVVRPAPGFQLIATMNGRPEEILDDALLSRFAVQIEMNEPNPDAIAALPEDVRELARNSAVCPDVDRRIRLRVWKKFVQYREQVGETVAAQGCFQHRAQEILDALRIARGGVK